MGKVLEIKGCKIPKVNMDFEKVANGQQRIGVGTSINIMIPKDVTDGNCVVAIKTEFKNNKQEMILSVVIRGVVEINDAGISDEDKEELIKHDVVPIVYEQLRRFIEHLLENAQINFINIPPYEELRI